ncbi:MAG: LON peptidase substrate-binding domain-containing protein, partial [Alphaproteobacteria bacterium]|nr:LON peptidase substrate-binding domain-containing protein [Alphaproteobacteria bacterium]
MRTLPLLALPKVVLSPQGFLPLQLGEPHELPLLRAALAADRQIAIVQLCDEDKKDLHRSVDRLFFEYGEVIPGSSGSSNEKENRGKPASGASDSNSIFGRRLSESSVAWFSSQSDDGGSASGDPSRKGAEEIDSFDNLERSTSKHNAMYTMEESLDAYHDASVEAAAQGFPDGIDGRGDDSDDSAHAPFDEEATLLDDEANHPDGLQDFLNMTLGQQGYHDADQDEDFLDDENDDDNDLFDADFSADLHESQEQAMEEQGLLFAFNQSGPLTPAPSMLHWQHRHPEALPATFSLPLPHHGPHVHRVGCIGRIVHFEDHENGNIVLHLKGEQRFTLIGFHTPQPSDARPPAMATEDNPSNYVKQWGFPQAIIDTNQYAIDNTP